MSEALALEEFDVDIQEPTHTTYEPVSHDEIVEMTKHFIQKHRRALEALANA